MFKAGDNLKYVYALSRIYLPDYAAHSGELVTVKRRFVFSKKREEWSYIVSAESGWEGEVYESELQDISNVERSQP